MEVGQHGNKEKMKKVFLTGHTAGIGLAIKNRLQDHYDVSGGSRSNGFDIFVNYGKVKTTILNGEYDIFINNAYVPSKQTQLLKEIYSGWKNHDKTIINIGSVAGDLPQGHVDYYGEYSTNKREQKEFIENINFNYSKKDFKNGVRCKLTNIKTDYVLTDFPSIYDKKDFPSLTPEYVSEIVYFVLQQPKEVGFREISFHSTSMPINWR